MATPLREIDAPSGPDVDTKFGDTVANRFHVAKKSSFKPLDPSDHNATNRRICQVVEPRSELREWLDAEHVPTVIERLHSVKPTLSDSRQREPSALRVLRAWACGSSARILFIAPADVPPILASITTRTWRNQLIQQCRVRPRARRFAGDGFGLLLRQPPRRGRRRRPPGWAMYPWLNPPPALPPCWASPRVMFRPNTVVSSTPQKA